MKCSSRACIVLLVAGAVLFGGGPFPGIRPACWGKVEGDRELFDRVKVAQVSNRERLSTWEGEVSGQVYSKREGTVLDRTVRIRFAYDRAREAWLFHWVIGKAPGDPFQGTEFGGMWLDKAWHSYDFYKPSPKSEQLVRIAAAAPPPIGPMSAAFDPMECFRLGYRDLEAEFDLWRQQGDADWMKLAIRREGDLVVVTRGNTKFPKVSNRYVFDLAKDGNLLSYVAEDDNREEQWFHEWEQRGGVWVPRTSRYENVSRDGKETSKKTLTWQRSIANEPLSQDTFTLDTMGVVPGAKVSDSRLGKSWRHREAELAESKGDMPEVQPPQGNRLRAALAAILGLAALILVVGVAAWWGRRRSRQ